MCAGTEFSPLTGISAALLGLSLWTLWRKRWVVGGLSAAASLLVFIYTFTLACG